VGEERHQEEKRRPTWRKPLFPLREEKEGLVLCSDLDELRSLQERKAALVAEEKNHEFGQEKEELKKGHTPRAVRGESGLPPWEGKGFKSAAVFETGILRAQESITFRG